MSGTFEEAKTSYEKFYSMDFRKFGVDIPPRLSDAMIDANKLIPTQQILSLNVPNSKDLEIEHKNKKEQIGYIN